MQHNGRASGPTWDMSDLIVSALRERLAKLERGRASSRRRTDRRKRRVIGVEVPNAGEVKTVWGDFSSDEQE